MLFGIPPQVNAPKLLRIGQPRIGQPRIDQFSNASSHWRLTALVSALAVTFVPTTAMAEDEGKVPTQLSPSGYSGAINTPTADVLDWGEASFALTNSNPERMRGINEGSFGSLNAGVGILPGLELVGRLAFEGDLNCNMYDSPNCPASQRDLSLSAKYQLPFKLPLNTRLAVGFTDYGGAATNYRQAYGVASSEWGLLHLSVGYSRPESSQALMDGVFASTMLRLTERWTAALETDTQEKRLGIHYRRPVTDNTHVQLSLSRKLSDASGQEPWQATAAINIQLGNEPKPIREVNEFAGARLKYSHTTGEVGMPRMQANTTLQPLPNTDLQRSKLQAEADLLAKAMTDQGFSQVKVQHWPATATEPGLWWVQVEPRKWRQNHLDAVGIALAQWKKQFSQHTAEQLLLTLTYQREPTTSAFTSAQCMQDWLHGWQECNLGDAIQFSHARQWPQAVQNRLQTAPAIEATQQGNPSWAPQIEIGPNLRTTVGTEYGLADYSLALDVGAEIALAPGLFWQGVYTIPLANSEDFDDGRVFAERRHPDAGFDSSLLTYWKALPKGVSAQASIGYISRDEKGVQADAVWMSPNGRWRVGATAARYNSDGKRLSDQRTRQPLIGSLRYSVIPGTWQLEASGGQFMLGDQGYEVASSHWFGDTRLQLYYRSTEFTAGQVGERSFLGFTFSLPLGPKDTKAISSLANVRGRDQWTWGLETKVGEDDNLITYGYGMVPVIRHGVLTDVTDHDRNGQADMAAQFPRLRERLKAQLGTR